MPWTIAEIADFVGGTLHGDGSRLISAVLPIDAATPDAIAFLSGNKRPADAERSKAGALFVCPGFGRARVPTIEVPDPRQAALSLALRFRPPPSKPTAGVHSTAIVDPSASIDANASIGPYAVVEAGVSIGAGSVLHSHVVVRFGCSLGDECEIHPHAVLYPYTTLGDHAIVHAGAVLGADGFGYTFTADGHTKLPQLGHVEVGHNVEIGANSTVDRAMLGATTVGDGTKIDNLVMVGHNCRLGRHNVLAAQVGIAGSSQTGDYVFLAGQVGISDHVSIGDGAVVTAGSGVHKNVPAGARHGGRPARESKAYTTEHAALSRLPRLLKEFAELRRRLEIAGEERKCA